jgi:predicted AAA+ superfamily ATPase
LRIFKEYTHSMLIERPTAIDRVIAAFRVHPAVALVGPRQCGKTTLARMITAGEQEFTIFDLESAVDRRRLESPEQALLPLGGLVVIDEVQRQPQLFETLRVLLDRPEAPARFLLLGSASPRLIRSVSETLAGRVGIVDLAGFDLQEVTQAPPGGDWKTLWQRGGFPRSYLAVDDEASALWRENFIRTFLERDVPQLGINIPAETLRRFWTMIAHYHGPISSRALTWFERSRPGTRTSKNGR